MPRLNWAMILILEIIFLKLSGEMFNDILLTVGHDRFLYLLFFLHQKNFPAILQELLHGFMKGIIS